MNFNELRQKAELLNLLNMQKRPTPKDQKEVILLNIELNKFAKFFEVSNSTYQKHLEEHFKKLGKSVEFLVETSPAKGYKKSDKITTKNYIINVFNNSYAKRNVKPDKRYTWQSKTYSENKRTSSNFNLMYDLFESPIKTTLFSETPGIKEVYWKMVEENFREVFIFKTPSVKNPKTGKYERPKFDKKTTDVTALTQAITNDASEARTI